VVKHVDAAELRVVVAAVLAVAAYAVHVQDQCKKLRVAVWHGKQEMPVASSRVSQTGK
jgi:hypothetical protein